MEEAILEVLVDNEEILHYDNYGIIFVLQKMIADDSSNFRPPIQAAMVAAIKSSGIL